MSNIVTISENQVALYITPTPSNAPNEEFNIVLHDTIFNREVKYTLNGTDPITNGAIFSNPITIEPELNKPVNLRISFYDFVTKTYEVYDGVYTISGNIVASYPCNEKANLESVLTPLLNIVTDPIESTLALLNTACNDSFTYEFSIVFGLECDDEFRYINNDAVDSIESSLTGITNTNSYELESLLDSNNIDYIHSENTENIESSLQKLLHISSDPIESLLITGCLNIVCNDSFPYEFDIVFGGYDCDDIDDVICDNDIESSPINNIESIYNIIENRILDNIESTLIIPQTLEVIDMGSIFPITLADNTIACKDEYLFSDYVWTNNTGKVATMLVDGSLTVDDDLVIDGVIFEAGMYPLEGVICSPPKNQAHTYIDNYLLKANIQPGQTVTLNIVNHYSRPTGVSPGGSIKIVTSDVPFGISSTSPCDEIESLLKPVEFNNKEDIESVYIYNTFYNIISKLLMGDYFPEVFDVDNSGCKDNYLFSSVNWTNNSGGAVDILVDGYLTVDDDLVIDGVIFEEGQYGIGVCFPDDKNVTHTYPNNYLIKENVLPGQTVNIDIVNHFGVPTSGSGCLKMVSSVSNDNVLKIDNTPACTPNESILNHISINNNNITDDNDIESVLDEFAVPPDTGVPPTNVDYIITEFTEIPIVSEDDKFLEVE